MCMMKEDTTMTSIIKEHCSHLLTGKEPDRRSDSCWTKYWCLMAAVLTIAARFQTIPVVSVSGFKSVTKELAVCICVGAPPPFNFRISWPISAKVGMKLSRSRKQQRVAFNFPQTLVTICFMLEIMRCFASAVQFGIVRRSMVLDLKKL
jgi:hypothetical protein